LHSEIVLIVGFILCLYIQQTSATFRHIVIRQNCFLKVVFLFLIF